ncbi:hypothetical protein DVH02_24205 [Streptomyces corynorhini]|uniref:DUF6194 domain-containing protein n=2 Tax=Streptomyces corynorhini TaxID=2282652 RepID=A0A370B4S3_9ACTN|nr:hypothetical protein DVH02_24205 [Streptomyces corynorhini]
MTMAEITGFVADLDGVLTVRPGPDDGSPEISWGDTYFFYAPDGAVPTATQPFATLVTKNHPGDELSRLDRPDTFRLNVGAGRDAFAAATGRAPREAVPDDDTTDPGAVDTLIAHPVYGSLGWLAVVDPGPRTERAVRELLRTAHHLARARHERRAHTAPSGVITDR